eukprot:gnl/TRDRNA2_/TRDRNA2_147333_c2_seq1.p2 gnl/TRDRNA2_/TRDRNA2_147333_c2~~gnl/TRDRNA2_/TRDRNA2_147333_c2_seq1.p2  ORF type:complete len:102 (-),score=10.46 gnl/TRDRNA2_/TRDRNA2_147333_c2_seq1:7-312(-)
MPLGVSVCQALERGDEAFASSDAFCRVVEALFVLHSGPYACNAHDEQAEQSREVARVVSARLARTPPLEPAALATLQSRLCLLGASDDDPLLRAVRSVAQI